MNDSTSFDIQLFTNDAGNEYIVIDAQITQEESCGFVVLDAVNDIFALRDAIDAFISKHQISRINE